MAKQGEWGLQLGALVPPPPPKKNPAAKFASQSDAHVRTDAQTKFLYYPLSRCFTVPFSLILMHQQLLELLIFSIATIFLPQSEDLYVLVVFQILQQKYLYPLEIKNQLVCMFFICDLLQQCLVYLSVLFCLYEQRSPTKVLHFLFLQLSVACVHTSSQHMVH